MRRILIVEDNCFQAKMLSKSLEKRGFHTSIAEDGEEGLLKARIFSPDVIVSDIEMPRMDGHAMVEALKSDDTLRHIPIIMLTSSDETFACTDALAAGAKYFVRKPANPDELLLLINSLNPGVGSHRDRGGGVG